MGCFDNDGNSHTTVNSQANDPEAARRMAAVAERSQDIADQQWSRYQEIFLPYENDMVAMNQALLPYMQEASQRDLESQVRLAGDRENAQRLGLQEITRDIEMNRPVKEAIVDRQLTEMEQSAPVSEAYYDEVLNGVNVQDRMNQAQADVALGLEQSQDDMATGMARMGIQRGSTKWNRAMGDFGQDKGKAIALGRTMARRDANNEKFQRLGSGMAARNTTPGLAGTANMTAAGMSANPYYNPQDQVGGYGLQSAATSANQWMNTSASANSAGMGRYTTDTQSNWDGSGGGMQAVGGIAGGLGGYYMSSQSK